MRETYHPQNPGTDPESTPIVGHRATEALNRAWCSLECVFSVSL